MDGTMCGGNISYGRTLPTTVAMEGVSDGTTLKPFMFSSLALTGGASHPDLGVIELVIYPINVSRSKSYAAPSRLRDLSALKVHERSKKAVTQQITFVATLTKPCTSSLRFKRLAQSERLEKPINMVSIARIGPDIVKFFFKYRPMGKCHLIFPLPT
ncbi:hypothetical protein B0H19DRAFT_62185 [Mycena capillaripes]|nr:hypothetical protein B0H19DRAFT_62185 [Mycena capillaripes]